MISHYRCNCIIFLYHYNFHMYTCWLHTSLAQSSDLFKNILHNYLTVPMVLQWLKLFCWYYKGNYSEDFFMSSCSYICVFRYTYAHTYLEFLSNRTRPSSTLLVTAKLLSDIVLPIYLLTYNTIISYHSLC